MRKVTVPSLILLFSGLAHGQNTTSNADEQETKRETRYNEANESANSAGKNFVPVGFAGYVVHSREDHQYSREEFSGYRGCIVGPAYDADTYYKIIITPIDLQETTYSESLPISLKDGAVTLRVHVVLFVRDTNEATLKSIVERYGAKDWYNASVKEPYRTIIRRTVQNKTYNELISIDGQKNVEAAIMEDLTSLLSAKPFVAVSVSIGGLDPSEALKGELAQTSALEQERGRLAMQKDIAEKRREVAEAEAAAEVARLKILTPALTPLNVQNKYAEALMELAKSPNAKVVILGPGVPIGAASVGTGADATPKQP